MMQSTKDSSPRVGGSRRRHRATPMAAAAFVALLVGRAALADAIVLQDGRRISDISITEATWEQVTYTLNGSPARKAGDEIRAIERDSRELAAGRRKRDEGDLADAAREYSRVATSGSNGWEKAEALYTLGDILIDAGKYGDAEKAFNAYLKGYRDAKDWYVPFAVEGLGRAALESGKGTTAAKHYEELAGFGANWTHKARIGQGHALLAAKQYSEARQVFRQVSTGRAPPALMEEAAVGRAESLVAQEQYDEAIRDLEGEFFGGKEPTYSRARARATLLAGLAYKGKGGKENLEQAEIWLLRVTGLYSNYPKEYQRAATELAAVYDALGNAERAGEWKTRSGAPKS